MMFRPNVDDEVADELELHIAALTRDLMAQGLDAASARAEALRRFGDVARVRRECRTIAKRRDRMARIGRWASELRQDAGYAVRQLARNRGFAGVAVLTLALGIGVTTAIFSVIEGVLLRSLPYPAADRLVVPQSQNRREPSDRWTITYADYEDWRRAGVFARVAAYRQWEPDMTGEGVEPQRVKVAEVSEDFFATLGLAPVIGRFPTPEEFAPGHPSVMVISLGLWQRVFGGNVEVLDRTVRLRGEPVSIVGVAPAELNWPRGADAWSAQQYGSSALDAWRDRDNYLFSGIARLVPGRSLEETRTMLDGLARRVERDHPTIRENITVTATPVGDFVAGETLARVLWLMLGAVGVILVIACVNVANLLLARSGSRLRELSIRQSLGAGRRRVARQLLTESLVLAAAGGAAGVLVAWAGIEAILALAPAAVPRLDEVGVNSAVLAFALCVSVAAALVFGLAPAFQATRSAGATALRSEARTTSTRRTRRLRDVLVVSELALSLILLVGAGLLVRSLDRLRDVDPGFETAGLLTFSISLPANPIGTSVERFQAIVDGLEAVPGVSSATVASALPLGGGGFYLSRTFLPEGRPEPPAGEEVRGQWTVISPGYFATLGTPVLLGREFDASDRTWEGAALDAPPDSSTSVPVMIVNRAFARAMFGEEAAALGQRVRSWRDENVYREIVGITEDVRYFGAGDEIRPLVYVPHTQNRWSSMVVVARIEAPTANVTPAIRAAVAQADPRLALARLQTMDTVLADSVAPRRFAAFLVTAFAILALVLATVGIYGVLAYTVSQRTREIGVRMALGAERGAVLRMVMRHGMAIVGAGLAIGAVGALLLARTMASLLYETSATDPTTFIATVALLAAVALAASWLPARRATRVDPVEAIRAD